MHRAAVAPQRRTHRANTRPARALLLPQLLAGAGDQFAVLGGVRALALRGTVVLDRLPQQSLVDLPEYRIGQVERAHLLTVQIDYIYLCHRLLPGACSPQPIACNSFTRDA